MSSVVDIYYKRGGNQNSNKFHTRGRDRRIKIANLCQTSKQAKKNSNSKKQSCPELKREKVEVEKNKKK